jgi:PAS domain S-box-containing protein
MSLRMPASDQFRERIAELEARLEVAEDTLRAIQHGEVDAVVVACPDGDQIFTLQGADHPYRVLVEQMHEGTLTLDRDGLILYSNQQFADLVQAPLESIVGNKIERFLPAESRQMFGALLQTGASSHGRCELTLTTARGNSVPVFAAVSRLDGARSDYLCAIVTDLTEQKRNEAIVQEASLSRLILEQAAEAIVVIDCDGKILRASDAAHRLAGRNVLLQPFDEAFPLKLEAPAAERVDVMSLLAAVRKQSSWEGTEVRLSRTGRPAAALLMSAGGLRTPGGGLIGCVVTLADITERKAAEDALAQQARELERSNYDLRQFAHSASHDLREPLRVISLYTQLVAESLKKSPDEEARRWFDQVIAATHRGMNLLNDLLSYMESAEDVAEPPTETDARLALEKALEGLQDLVLEQGASIDIGDLPRLRVREVHLVQVFQNLVSNALKYRGEHPVKVCIAAEPEQGMWKLSVADNGIGIASRYQSQVFGLFKRLHPAGKYSGSGIGLAICQRIVERYGGRIWVDSRLGAGSTFFFTAPAATSLSNPETATARGR